MRKVIKNELAQEMLNNHYLLPIERYKNGFLMTDFNKTYHLSKAFLGGKQEKVWFHNQSFCLYEVNENYSLPNWFDKKLYNKVIGVKTPISGSNGFCYYPKHNPYTGCGWYASNANEAIRAAIWELTPIWDISLKPMNLIFDNGEIGYINKAMQLWKHNEIYHLTFFHSMTEKKINIENITDDAITLIIFATDNKESRWRINKRWTKFLKFTGKIGEFKEISIREAYGIISQVTEVIEIAKANEYIIARMEWGSLFGGEGDTGEDLYIFENEKEVMLYIEKMHKIESKQNSKLN